MSSYDERDQEVDDEIRRLKELDTKPPAKCPHCGSDKIIPAASASNGEGSLAIRVAADPTAILFKGYESELVTATVCGECGYTLFFANNPGRLFAAYQTSLKSKQAKNRNS